MNLWVQAARSTPWPTAEKILKIFRGKKPRLLLLVSRPFAFGVDGSGIYTDRVAAMPDQSLYQLLVKSAEQGLSLQAPDGSLPVGHNGPWRDEDSVLRTTAHWSRQFKFAFEQSGGERFLEAHRRAIACLLCPDHRPHAATFFCRLSPREHKNHCNGLIGQAWVLEALLEAHPSAARDECLDLSAKILDLIPYSEREHGWHFVEVDGKVGEAHSTVNQQLWFAALSLLAARLLDRPEYVRNASDCLSWHLEYPTWHRGRQGLFSHEIPRVGWLEELGGLFKKPSSNAMDPERFIPGFLVKAEGYLTFILYGIALAKKVAPDLTVWKSTNARANLAKGFAYVLKRKPFGYQGGNPFQWAYNPVGIEMAFALQELGDWAEIQKGNLDWLQLQIDGHYDSEKGLLCKNSEDPNILAARFYEASRLADRSIKIIGPGTNT